MPIGNSPGGASVVAGTLGTVPPSGGIAETFPRYLSVANAAVLTSQTVYVALIGLQAGTVITSIAFWSGTQALVGGVNQVFGIYSTFDNSLQAHTTDDTSTAWGTNSIKTLNLTAKYAVPSTGQYWLAILVNATTPPSLQRILTVATVLATAPTLCGTGDSGVTSLQNPLNGPSGLTNFPYAFVS